MYIISAKILNLREFLRIHCLNKSFERYTIYAIIHVYCELRQMKVPQGRAQLIKVLAASGDVVHISDVTQALGVSRTDAAKRLARWREQAPVFLRMLVTVSPLPLLDSARSLS